MWKQKTRTTNVAWKIAIAIVATIGVSTIVAVAGLLPATFIEHGVCGPPEGPVSESPASCAREWLAILIGIGTVCAALVAGRWAWSAVQDQIREARQGVQDQIMESRDIENLRAMREDLASLDALLAQCVVYQSANLSPHITLNKTAVDVVQDEHIRVFHDEILNSIMEIKRIVGGPRITFVTSVERLAGAQRNAMIIAANEYTRNCAAIAKGLRDDLNSNRLIGITLTPFKILELPSKNFIMESDRLDKKLKKIHDNIGRLREDLSAEIIGADK